MSTLSTYFSGYTPTRVRAIFPALAVSALISTLVLIVMGSIVRVTGYGLGCPDWPLCYGQVIPPFDIAPWVEFTHRLIGAATSVQIVLLTVFAWREFQHRNIIFFSSIAAVALLVIQIGLGGLHVIYELPLSTGWIHTATAMAIAGLVGVLVGVSHPTAKAFSQRLGASLKQNRLPLWVGGAALATYVLILTGSFVTRTGASLACPSFPYCGLDIEPLPRLASIQMLHRYMAIAVGMGVIAAMWRLLQAGKTDSGVRKVAGVIAGLVTLQFSLGIINVIFYLPMWSRALHLLIAATLWASLVVLWAAITNDGWRVTNGE